MFFDFDKIWERVVDIAADRILEEAQKLSEKIYGMFSNGRLREVRIFINPEMRTSRQAIVWSLGLKLAKSRLAKEGKKLMINARDGWIILSLRRGRVDGRNGVVDAWRGLLRIASTWANIRDQIGEIMEIVAEKAPRKNIDKLLRVFEALDTLLLILSMMDQ